MAITLLGTASTGQQGYGASITQPHTIPSGGVNSILVVGILAYATTGTPTYNGTSLTLAKLGTDGNTSIWYLLSPASGTHDIIVPLNSGTSKGVLIAQAFNGCNLTTPIGATAAASGQGVPSTTLTVDASAGTAFNFIGELLNSPDSASGRLTDWTHGTGQTLLLNATDGTEYNAYCSASYKAGASSMSVSSSLYRLWSHVAVVIAAEATAATAPDAPTIGTATAGNGQVSVTFTAPSNNGGAAISGYTATLYKVSDNTTVGTNTGTTSPIVVASTNGLAVYAKVKATNSAGTGAESVASNSATAVTTATAIAVSGPTTGVAGAASSNFTVSANGPITGTVVVTPAATGCTFTPSTVSISSGSPTATFTVNAASAGAKTISFTNNGSLTNQASLTYTASAAASGATFAASGKLKNLNGSLLPDGAYSVMIRNFTPVTGSTVAVKTTLAMVSGVIPSFTLSGPVAGTEYVYEVVNEADNKIRGLARATPT